MFIATRLGGSLVGGLVVVATAVTAVSGQSRSAPLSVSAVVVRRCSVAASEGPSAGSKTTTVVVSMSCSARAADAVRMDAGATQRLVAPRVVGQYAREFRVVLHTGDSLVTLQF